ncbi:sensor histidine kinase [Microbacterium terricola]|uniref:Two-component sensor histidine kinase n=1 Tax=Microbacterium terricola TaxID=344163 RepID=A0ABM8E0Y6_9MICO|nr:sensor histidine kinase [Microbacterium terricola]UYK40674.1 sensor histidine kinase [Microbacterium terricola]BDV31593.1 two-component sensor histidine kinase [Microbacterium terricola]
MPHTALTPVFVGLRTGLHALFAALAVLVIVRALVAPTDASVTVIGLTLLLGVTYALGSVVTRHTEARWLLRSGWLILLTLEWVLLVWLTPDAAYLVFPLFFLYLHLLGRWWGSAAILVSTIIAICALGLHSGWTVGGVIGPLVGAGVALLIGLGYQALAREAAEREALVRELIATRGLLAATEHESGVLAERARLAREIHDTLAQGLSSIQMLLHAAERADPGRPGIEHIHLARETAAANLAEARRFIRELTPPQLDDQTLAGALRRLARTQWAPQGLDVQVRVSDALVLPMHLQTALLRIAQGAIANVIQHAHASTATITIAVDHDQLRFTVADDGIGFDPSQTLDEAAEKSDSFGLRAASERVQQLGGTLTIDAAPGRGSIVAVDLTLTEHA